MATADKKPAVILVTSDDENYTVDRNVAERSVMIKGMIEGESGTGSMIYSESGLRRR